MLPLSYSVRNVALRPLRSLLSVAVIALVVVACSLLPRSHLEPAPQLRLER